MEAILLIVIVCCHVHRGQDALKVKLELGLLLVIILVAVFGAFVLFFAASLAATLTFVCFAFTFSGDFAFYLVLFLLTSFCFLRRDICATLKNPLSRFPPRQRVQILHC